MLIPFSGEITNYFYFPLHIFLDFSKPLLNLKNKKQKTLNILNQTKTF